MADDEPGEDITIAGSVSSAPVPGDPVYLGTQEATVKLSALSSPDPALYNHTISISSDSGRSAWVNPDVIRVRYSGTQKTPALRFTIGGWEYTFPTIEMARKVREKLMEMTLEGEL